MVGGKGEPIGNHMCLNHMTDFGLIHSFCAPRLKSDKGYINEHN